MADLADYLMDVLDERVLTRARPGSPTRDDLLGAELLVFVVTHRRDDQAIRVGVEQ